MEIEYGAEVADSKGKQLGLVDYIVRDTYTGEVRKFKVNTGLVETDLFYSPEDVAEASAAHIKLNKAFGEPESG